MHFHFAIPRQLIDVSFSPSRPSFSGGMEFLSRFFLFFSPSSCFAILVLDDLTKQQPKKKKKKKKKKKDPTN